MCPQKWESWVIKYEHCLILLNTLSLVSRILHQCTLSLAVHSFLYIYPQFNLKLSYSCVSLFSECSATLAIWWIFASWRSIFLSLLTYSKLNRSLSGLPPACRLGNFLHHHPEDFLPFYLVFLGFYIFFFLGIFSCFCGAYPLVALWKMVEILPRILHIWKFIFTFIFN